MSLLGLGAEPSVDVCSRAGCTASAVWQVRWRNPKIHTADRVKVWLACEEHRDYLREFVNARGFLIDVIAFEEAV